MGTSRTVEHSSNAGHAAARECAAISADLDRLKALIADAGDRLMSSFNQVGELAPTLARDDAERRRLNTAVGNAVTALQFQDMATQLTQHAQRRLSALQDCLAQLSAEGADELSATARLQPVRQSAMGAGSIDLF
jgi:hypothetical protein